jgi:ketosteroid isomerase-like protein
MTGHGYTGDEMTTEPNSVDPHPNVVTYLEAIEAFNRDDLDAVQDHVRADVVYRIPGDSSIAGEYQGIDGFARILRRLRTESDGTLELTPVAVLADDENLIARARATARRGTKTLDTENVYAFRFIEGRLADGQVFLSDPSQVDAFWA